MAGPNFIVIAGLALAVAIAAGVLVYVFGKK